MRRLLLSLAIAGCAHAPAVPVDVWTRDLGNGESQRLLLFESGVMGFQHVGAELPISRAYGHWSRDQGGVRLYFVGVEPAGTTAPETIDLTRWAKVADPYGTSPGARERATTDERSWTYLVSSAAPSTLPK
jgi:hypothetical protein